MRVTVKALALRRHIILDRPFSRQADAAREKIGRVAAHRSAFAACPRFAFLL
jgi:hypothetical protein